MLTPYPRSYRPFELVRENLKKIGAVPLSEYLAATRSGTSCANISRHDTAEEVVNSVCLPEQDPIVASMSSPTKEKCIFKLKDAAEAAFGDYPLADALRFDIARRSGDPNGIQCILTVTRPNGAHRIYESQACHSRNHDAKVQAAQIALEKGAIDFMCNGDVEMREPELPAPVLQDAIPMEPNDGLVTAEESVSTVTLDDVPMVAEETALGGRATVEDDANVLEIQRACKGWLSTRPLPDWVFYQSNETGASPLRWGAALRIHLTMPQVYSTEMAYSTAHAAKAACAELAMEQNVVHDIKNVGDFIGAPVTNEKPQPPQTVTTAISLDDWFGTLPRPLPDIFGTKPAAEIAAPSMLNTWITKARGARFKIDYFFPVVRISDVYALHGCVLRIDRPGLCRSYLVDPVFSRRHDARHAVSLLAILQGAGEYIRQVGAEIDSKITPRLRTLVHERIFTILGRKDSADTHAWTFNIDREAYGCTLTVEFGSEEHVYVAEPDYRTKADAKCAAALVAAERGLVELLRFRGDPPPPDYKPFWETFQAVLREDDGAITNEKGQTKKRKRADGEPVPTASSGRRKRKKVLKMKMAEEAAAAAAALGQNELSGSSAEPQGPSTSESDIVGKPVGAPASGSEPASSMEPQPPAPAAMLLLSEEALGKKPLPSEARTRVEPVAANSTLSQKALGKKPATDSSTSHIGGDPLGKSSKSKSKSKHSASPVSIPQGYELPPPATPAYPYLPPPPPPPPPVQRPYPLGYAFPPRLPPRPYDFDYGLPAPHPQTYPQPYPHAHAPPTFGAPHPQPYPFTGPCPPPRPPRTFHAQAPGHYPHAREPRGEPPRRYAYGPGIEPPPPPPSHRPPQGMPPAPPPYMGKQPGPGASQWGHARR